MAKADGAVVRDDEVWMVRNDGKRHPQSQLHTDRRPIVKITARYPKGDPQGRGGRFHGATNLRGTVRY